MPLSVLAVIGIVLVGGALVACARRSPAVRSPPGHLPAPAVTVVEGDFHGWPALVLRNAVLEVTVVPAIGRIMQIAPISNGAERSGDDGPLWSHPGIGPGLPADENGWINLGGDKAWPAPQAEWEKMTGRGWPPPKAFDAAAHRATVADSAVTLLSPIDPAYGLRVRRTITLAAAEPRLTVETRYEKVAGAPVRVAVWTITQLASPERLFMRLPERSAFPGGFVPRLPDPPKELEVDGRLLSLARDRDAKTMIAGDGDALLWVGARADLLIETLGGAHEANDQWPEGAHAQIYTSSDQALPYVELELLGPLRELQVGGAAAMTVRYTLSARREADPTAEARRLLHP
jgi:hypothetical protein